MQGQGSRGARTAALMIASLVACSPVRENPPPATSIATLGVGYRDADDYASVDLRHQADVGESTVPHGLTAVWNVLPSVFEQLEIDLTFFDERAGALGNEGYRARRIEGQRMSRWLDCGRDLVQANADGYDVRLAVLVQLLTAPGNETTVRTTVDAYARPRGTNTGQVHCVSWGLLERRIPELVMERLAG